jgi:hypothetical protein
MRITNIEQECRFEKAFKNRNSSIDIRYSDLKISEVEAIATAMAVLP